MRRHLSENIRQVLFSQRPSLQVRQPSWRPSSRWSLQPPRCLPESSSNLAVGSLQSNCVRACQKVAGCSRRSGSSCRTRGSAHDVLVAALRPGAKVFIVSDENVAAHAMAAAQAALDEPKELDWDDVDQVDLIGLEIGYGLIPLVNPETGGQLMSRVKGVRKKLSAELGFLVQPVRIRDALNIDPDAYHIVLKGVARGKGQIKVGRELAINPGQVYGPLEGQATKEPAFGLDAVWIDPAERDHARTLGYTVVDASTAVATHLNKVLRDNAADLLSHDEVQQLLDKLAAKSPKLVEDLVPGKLSLGVVTRTLQNLLNESVSIRDMRSIVETLSEVASRTQEPDQLTALVRPKLGRMIVQSLVDDSNSLAVMTLDPGLEQLLHNVLQQSAPGQNMAIEPGLAERLFAALREGARAVEELGHPAVLVVSPTIRPWLSRAARYRVNDLTLLSYSEIPDDQSVKVVHTVHAENN